MLPYYLYLLITPGLSCEKLFFSIHVHLNIKIRALNLFHILLNMDLALEFSKLAFQTYEKNVQKLEESMLYFICSFFFFFFFGGGWGGGGGL